MRMLQTPLVKVKGDAYNRGFQHGSQAKTLIKHNLDFYERFFTKFLNLAWDEAATKVENSISRVERYDKELLDEIAGIAAGAEKRLEDIFILNSRYELSITSIAERSREGCTSYALTPEMTKSRHTLIGQNWDYRQPLKESCILLAVKQEKKPSILMHVEAGTVGHKGLNSAGLGLCVNALISSEDRIEPAIPLVSIIPRAILNADKLRDALAAILKVKRSASINFMLGHADGEILDLEVTPTDVFVLYPEQGVLTHANNFLHTGVSAKDLGKASLPDSVTRWHRMKKLLQKRKGKLGFSEIRGAVSDHFDYPYSLCRHADDRSDPDRGFETVASVVMDLNMRRMYLAEGNPCHNAFVKVPLDVTRL